MNETDFDISFDKIFPSLSLNKKREIQRLIFEISKIKNIDPVSFLNSIKNKDFHSLKQNLLSQRYPSTFNKADLKSFYLPQYDIDPSLKADTKGVSFYPKTIYYEKDAASTLVFENVIKAFPNSCRIEIESLKDFVKNKVFSIKDYNERRGSLFLIKEKYDFFKPCPCAMEVKNCGYSIMNLGMGCPYECSYCFLQNYQNIPGIVLICNTEDFLKDETVFGRTEGFFNYKRIGSGEWIDSLAFDGITKASAPIIEYFRSKKDIFFEFKTKSANIENILSNGGAENIVISWSLNSLRISKENEFISASIESRLNAAKQCAQASFSIAFHFDPIVYYQNWRKEYEYVVDMIFDIVPNDSIKWISLGSLRMPFALKKIIENRFPSNSILDGELLLGSDKKLRYEKDIRIELYKTLNERIKSKKSKVAVYLCMENEEIWKGAGI
ncbi:MAG: hypothetical protein LBH29_02680 [Elusimicrobiota bacterium]|jgi:spore photoproduct lyase|nr:hypothetical protein [Elusimicrobiota bacterium]